MFTVDVKQQHNNKQLPTAPMATRLWETFTLTLLHSERPKLYGVLAVLRAKGLTNEQSSHPAQEK